MFRGRKKEGPRVGKVKGREKRRGVFMHKNGNKFGPLFMRFIIFPRRFLFAAGNKCAREFIFEIRVSFSRTPPPEASNAMVLLCPGNSALFTRPQEAGAEEGKAVYIAFSHSL